MLFKEAKILGRKQLHNLRGHQRQPSGMASLQFPPPRTPAVINSIKQTINSATQIAWSSYSPSKGI